MQEAQKTADATVDPGKAYGFFTDTTVCIGCKACEVACKQWNLLPAERIELSGMSYDNTRALGATTWRHVAFVEQEKPAPNGNADTLTRWLMMSDVCKHCQNAGCLNACPTGAIIRTEFDTVYIQQDICNGCGYCVPACPFGVIEVSAQADGTAHKCTLCYDRLQGGLEPACAKACPTDSIVFGELTHLRERAQQRVNDLRLRGVSDAYLYGADDTIAGGLNAFFLLLDEPEVYNLPPDPTVPSDNVPVSAAASVVTGLFLGLLTVIAFLLGPRGQ
jgi:formate dehydrogenase iron-sulfur subunit